MSSERIKPLDGQLALVEGVPVVRYCRRCGRRLRSAKSIERGLGPTCYRAERKERNDHDDTETTDD